MFGLIRLGLRILLAGMTVALLLWLVLPGRGAGPDSHSTQAKALPNYPRNYFLRDINFDAGDISVVLDRGVIENGPLIQRDQALLRRLADQVSLASTDADRRRTLIDALFGGKDALDRRPAILIYREDALLHDFGCLGTRCLEDAETRQSLRLISETAVELRRYEENFRDYDAYLAEYDRVRDLPGLFAPTLDRPEVREPYPLSFQISLPATLRETMDNQWDDQLLAYENQLEAAIIRAVPLPDQAPRPFVRVSFEPDPSVIDTCASKVTGARLTGWTLLRPSVDFDATQQVYDRVAMIGEWSFLPGPVGDDPAPVIAANMPGIAPGCAALAGDPPVAPTLSPPQIRQYTLRWGEIREHEGVE